MTPKERAVMQQALEALESYSKSDYIKKQHPKRRAKGEKAITALREALADHTVRCKGCDELFDKICLDDDGVCASCGWPVWPAKKQAEQEPVAEVVLHSHKVGFGRTEERKDIVFLADVEVGTKLYAAPVRTKDLTDDEIATVYEQDEHHHGEFNYRFDPVSFARAVIAADREKNRG